MHDEKHVGMRYFVTIAHISTSIYILNTSYVEKKLNIVCIKSKYIIREVYFKHNVIWYNEVLLKAFDIIRLQNRRDTYSWKKMTKKVA